MIAARNTSVWWLTHPLFGGRVARELTDLVIRRGKPFMIVNDNRTEFTSHAIPKWTETNGLQRRPSTLTTWRQDA